MLAFWSKFRVIAFMLLIGISQAHASVSLSSIACLDLFNTNSDDLSQELQARAQQSAQKLNEEILNILKYSPVSIGSKMSLLLRPQRDFTVQSAETQAQILKQKFYTKTTEYIRLTERMNEVIEMHEKKRSLKLTPVESDELQGLKKKTQEYQSHSAEYLRALEKSIQITTNSIRLFQYHADLLTNMASYWEAVLKQTGIHEEVKALIGTQILNYILDLQISHEQQIEALVIRRSILQRNLTLIQSIEVQSLSIGTQLIPKMNEIQEVSKKKNIFKNKNVDPELVKIFSHGDWSSSEVQIALFRFLGQTYIYKDFSFLSTESFSYILSHINLQVSGVELEIPKLTEYIESTFVISEVRLQLSQNKYPIEFVNLLLAYIFLDRSKFITEGFLNIAQKHYKTPNFALSFLDLNKQAKLMPFGKFAQILAWVSAGYIVGPLIAPVVITKMMLGRKRKGPLLLKNTPNYADRGFVSEFESCKDVLCNLIGLKPRILEQLLYRIDQAFVGKNTQSSKGLFGLRQDISKAIVYPIKKEGSDENESF